MSPPVRPARSPLVTAAIAAAVLTAGLGGFVMIRILAPKPRQAVTEPPPLTWVEPPPVAPEKPPAPPPPPLPAATPERLAPIVAQAALPPEQPVEKLAVDQLDVALAAASDPARKLAIMRRLEKAGTPSARYAVAVMFSDPDKTVRLEALRIVEALDTENHVLMAKLHAVYIYEQDPEVKAQLDRLVQKYRPQEEAEARAREEAARLEAQALLPK